MARKNQMVVVMNPNPRCVKVPGLGLLKPGRNPRKRAMTESDQVQATMAQKAVKALGISILEQGKPEKMAVEKAKVVANETFDLDTLQEMLEKEERDDVKAEIQKQIDLILIKDPDATDDDPTE